MRHYNGKMEFYVLKFDIDAMTGRPAPAGYRGIRYKAGRSVWIKDIPARTRNPGGAVEGFYFKRVCGDGSVDIISKFWPRHYMRKLEAEDFEDPRVKKIMTELVKKAL